MMDWWKRMMRFVSFGSSFERLPLLMISFLCINDLIFLALSILKSLDFSKKFMSFSFILINAICKRKKCNKSLFCAVQVDIIIWWAFLFYRVHSGVFYMNYELCNQLSQLDLILAIFINNQNCLTPLVPNC